MLPGLTLPGSLVALLGALRRCFTAPSFRTFCGLAAGLAGQPRRRAVVGMLLGAGLPRAWPHDRALPDFPVGPVDEQRMQRTADAMLQFGLIARQYAAEVRQGTLIRSMISPS